jgi:putative effector of murein hydrolase LrgA (UPF0299 family)
MEYNSFFSLNSARIMSLPRIRPQARQAFKIFLLHFLDGLEVKFLIVPRVYTLAAFTVSIVLLLFFLPRVVLVPKVPYYLQDLFFTLILLCSLSTAIVWVIAAPVTLYVLRKRGASVTRSLGQNVCVVCLVVFTVIVAISGVIRFLEIVPDYQTTHMNGLTIQTGLGSPNPFGQLYGIGVLFCEAAWIIEVLNVRIYRKLF